MQNIGNWMIGRTYLTHLEVDMRQFPEVPGFPAWDHVGTHHIPLARLYWNMFHATTPGELQFHDAPDFSGLLYLEQGKPPIAFQGDIGQVSLSTFAIDVLPQMHKGDLWISIIDERHHVLIEFLEDIGALIHGGVTRALGLDT